MQILCIGEAVIDMICTDKGKPLSEGVHFLKKPGGAPTNVAAAIAALGGDVALAAKVGNDPFGKQLIDVMKEFGVSCQHVFSDDHHFTTMAFVSLMEDGERDFVFNRGADGQLSQAEVDSIDLSNVSIIHFGSATAFLTGPLQEAYLLLLQKAKDKGIYTSFDPNYRHLLFKSQLQSFISQSWTYLAACDFFKLSDEEAMLITGMDSIDAAANILMERVNGSFAITLGKDGTLLRHEQTLLQIASIPVMPVDTTGAGDAFVGAVLFQLNEYKPDQIRVLPESAWKAIVNNANKAGARTCEYMGAMEAFRHLNNQIFN